MKKAFTSMVAAALLSMVVLSPAYAGGGKNHGEVGQGEVDQGETGYDTGYAEGDDAQDNQAD